MIDDPTLRDFLTCALHAVPDERPTLQELAQHRFFATENTANDGTEIKLSGTFTQLAEEQREEQKALQFFLRNNSSASITSNNFSLPKRKHDDEMTPGLLRKTALYTPQHKDSLQSYDQ